MTALNLELNQGALRFEALRRDNGQLLQRWLDKMGQEADEMNDRSGFVEAEVRLFWSDSIRPTLTGCPVASLSLSSCCRCILERQAQQAAPTRTRTTSATNASSSSSRLRP